MTNKTKQLTQHSDKIVAMTAFIRNTLRDGPRQRAYFHVSIKESLGLGKRAVNDYLNELITIDDVEEISGYIRLKKKVVA